ncbi:MAG TPA: NAD(P)/FAD-dependent oxidoreductase, partial [Dongiaceae bacterium]|nr:NAD(P)/FAD-dependent oxidoreductase [Dongiaceae bacterium]
MIAAGRADAAVVGGGPAGAVTALLLARAGAAVVLYEQSRHDTLRPGETLPPSVNPVLRRLGLWKRFGALHAMPSYQTASAWDAAEPSDRSFILSPHGHGWHVDRARFDAMLVDAAEQAGARVLHGAWVGKVSRVDAGLRVEADEPVLAATVVDATGRTARVARALGANRAQLDRLVCAARVFAIGSEPPGDTFIEAAPDGWWYVSPLPDQRRIIALFTDAHEVVRARLATVDGWTNALARSEHVADLACGVPCGRIRVTTSASHELEPPVGRDWIAVGDAAFAVDPLSSGGVAFALRSATAAADVLLGGDRAAYQKQIADEASEYRRLRAEIYGWQHRFADAAFWSARRLSVDQPFASRAATSRAVGIDGA